MNTASVIVGSGMDCAAITRVVTLTRPGARYDIRFRLVGGPYSKIFQFDWPLVEYRLGAWL